MTKWISIKEKLPNINESVLITNLDFIDIGYLINENVEFSTETGLVTDATHWMPLPEKPKAINPYYQK